MPKSLAEFGQTIKAKHPEYGDMSDEEVGQKVLAKYPEYQDMVDIAKPDPNMATVTVKPPPPQKGFFSSASDASGLSGLGSAIMHPLKTANNVLDAGAMSLGLQKDTGQNPILNGLQQGIVDPLKRMVSAPTLKEAARNVPFFGPTMAAAQAQHDAGNDAGMAGTLAGSVAGLIAPKVLSRLPDALASAGETSQNSGVGLLNKTVGTLKNDFKRGANPSRGYFEAGGGPAMSMQGLADKGAALKEAVGTTIPEVLGKSTAVVDPQKLGAVISKPMAKAIALESGPGGMGNLAPIEQYGAGFEPVLQKALANGGLSPTDAWELKKSIAQNTNWSDPTQFNLKAVRQQQVGGLSGAISEAVPEVAPLNRQYGDLTKFAARAASRAETGSSPLTSLAFKGALTSAGALAGASHGAEGITAGALLGSALDSVPVRSTLASGLYYGGKGAKALSRLPTPGAAAVAVPAYALSAARAKRKHNEDPE